MQTKLKILYITRNGLLEPLGQSQVMNYLRGLSHDYVINLISYEKSKDLNNKLALSRAQSDCNTYGIRWLPQLYRPYPKIIGLLLSILRMIWMVRREAIRQSISLIHARSYIPAFIALVVNKLTGIPFVFDMRALWPEELITAGRINRGSLTHRVIVKIERACLAKSSAVVSLTNAAVNHLKSIYPIELKNKQIVVIPTCADLERFTPAVLKKQTHTIHGCIGTILSGWFLTDWLSSWIRVVASRDPNSHFEIVTRDEKQNVRQIIDPSNELSRRLKIGSQLSQDMPNIVRGHNLSVMFFTEGLSKLGSAPTRLAEALGCGLPVVVNEGVGDVADIVRKNKVGIIVEGVNQEQMEKAFDALLILMQDPNLNARCRATSETLFSLKKGTESYKQIYNTIINSKDTSCAA